MMFIILAHRVLFASRQTDSRLSQHVPRPNSTVPKTRFGYLVAAGRQWCEPIPVKPLRQDQAMHVMCSEL